MNGKDNKLTFLDYINRPMNWDAIAMIYFNNNIKFEKCQLYSDFVQSLLITIYDTYMGDDVTSIEDQINHFNWCWDRTINKFEEEGFYFEDEKIIEYFSNFMLEVFYLKTDKDRFDFTDYGILKLWLDIFDYKKLKSNSELDAFVEIYKLMDLSLKTEIF